MTLALIGWSLLKIESEEEGSLSQLMSFTIPKNPRIMRLSFIQINCSEAIGFRSFFIF